MSHWKESSLFPELNHSCCSSLHSFQVCLPLYLFILIKGIVVYQRPSCFVHRVVMVCLTLFKFMSLTVLSQANGTDLCACPRKQGPNALDEAMQRAGRCYPEST